MNQDIIIVIVTGPCAEAGTKFVQAIAPARYRLQPEWLRREHFKRDYLARRIIFVRAQPVDTESVVQKRIKDSHADNDHIAGILYFHDSEPRSGFLGLSHDIISLKCFIVTTCDVVSSADQVSANGLESGGKFRTIQFDGTPESAWSAVRLLLDEPSIHESPYIDAAPSISSSSTVTLGKTLDDHPSKTLSNESQNLGEDTPPNYYDRNQRAYEQSGLTTRRHANQAVVLVVGRSGHGKSTTINRLLGRDLLEMGRSNTTGSTTKVIQRVTIPVQNEETGVTVTVAFDDTPGYADTTYSHRADNVSLIHEYKRRFFTEPEPHLHPQTVHCSTFPNVILLVAEWSSITADAHNEPERFTSALGTSMFNLNTTGLVDPDRTNVIVVITKSMSSWDQFDDFEPDKKGIQWNIEAGKRISIILDLQRKVFRRSTQWRIVFIENGGGSKMDAPYKTLPNDELSHQNLFKAIYDVIAPRDTDVHDLAGIQALRLLSGGESFDLASKATTKVLLSPEKITYHTSQGRANSNTPSSSSWHPAGSDRIGELADEYLGVTYNPVSGLFGRTRILELRPSDVKITKQAGGQSDEFSHIKDTKQDHKTTATRLHVEFEMREVAGLSSHYSSSHTFKSAMSAESQLYLSQHLIYVAKVNVGDPRLSEKMIAEIKRLPPLHTASGPTKSALMQQYYDFFQKYGTHVILRVALGGVLRIVFQTNSNAEERIDGKSFGGDAHVPLEPANAAAKFSLDHLKEKGKRGLRDRVNVIICRDGGSSVASKLIPVLEQRLQNVSPSAALSDCTDFRIQWIEALEKDPVFCPDNQNTEYQWLYNLNGVPDQQKEDLRQASKSYLIARPDQKNFAPDTGINQAGSSANLPRKQNHWRVFIKFKKAFKATLHTRADGDSKKDR
ncbi:hypothetical protein BYT27DRAFT_7238143 [Phlegmacium glaucopus]|nr:hypothetical protein BYT27DRAFT_7238143 [Phlegmacium glaucopus]